MEYTIYKRENLNEENFIQWCKDNGYNVEEMDFNDWLGCEEERQYECLLEQLNEYAIECFVTGTLGLWWGKAEIEPTLTKSVNMALNMCIGSDVLEEVTMCDRYFEIVVSHHDGTNRFRVHPLSPVGLDRYNTTGVLSLDNEENTIALC